MASGNKALDPEVRFAVYLNGTFLGWTEFTHSKIPVRDRDPLQESMRYLLKYPIVGNTAKLV